MKDDLPFVSIVMPVRNEGSYISEAIDRIGAQDYPGDKIEVIVVDGASSDNTAEVVKERVKKDDRIEFIPGSYNCPAAMNAGIVRAKGAYLAKIDGHGYINDKFLRTAVSYLDLHPDCACIGGEIVPLGKDPISLSNMYARFSKFGVGSGVYTAPKSIHETDTVQCGVYVKKFLEDVGGFDADLQFGEDEEVNFRLVKAGHRIVYHPDMKYYYHVRPSFAALFRQYLNYGAARIKVVTKFPEFFKVKHIIPSVLVLSLSIGLALSPFSMIMLCQTKVLFLLYASFIGIGAVLIGSKNRFYKFHYLITSLIMLHFGYGLGMIQGFLARK
jgi:glycosyltransferase involved in cell wall biosynthesis